MSVLKCLLVLISLTSVAQCAKILCVFHVYSHSHFILGDALLKELAARGHEVTMVSPFKSDTPMKNYRSIHLTESKAFFERLNADIGGMAKMSIFEQMQVVNEMGLTISELAINSTNMQPLLKSNEHFDVVILEQFLSESLRGLQYHFKAPTIIFSTVGSSGWTNPIVGNPAPPSFVPDLFTHFSGKMTFWERMQNSLIVVFVNLMQHLYYIPKHNEIMHKYFPGTPNVNELMYDTSLVLLNSHVSINLPVPHVPNMIEVGGMHVQPPKKLPVDLQRFLDDAKEGAIYFSLGSNLKSKDLSVDRREAILKTFEKMKMKILWKWEADTLPGQPKNVKLGKWLPQQDILAHPNVKLFITHGGLLSTIETIYHGKPILGIPFFGDQRVNMAQSVKNGYGISLSLDDLSQDSFTAALNEILSNPTYSENAKRRQGIMHDQPIKPLDSAVFWVEHVIRHKGAAHFRSAALDLSWYQYLLLDVVAFILAVFLILLIVPFVVCKRLFCKSRKQPTQKINNKKKSN